MWNDPPDYDEVRQRLDERARLTGRLRSLELELTIAQAKIAKIAPRNPAARVIGTNDENGAELISLQQSIMRTKNDLDVVEAEIDFLNFRRDIYKTESYKGKL